MDSVELILCGTRQPVSSLFFALEKHRQRAFDTHKCYIEMRQKIHALLTPFLFLKDMIDDQIVTIVSQDSNCLVERRDHTRHEPRENLCPFFGLRVYGFLRIHGEKCVQRKEHIGFLKTLLQFLCD